MKMCRLIGIDKYQYLQNLANVYQFLNSNPCYFFRLDHFFVTTKLSLWHSESKCFFRWASHNGEDFCFRSQVIITQARGQLQTFFICERVTLCNT